MNDFQAFVEEHNLSDETAQALVDLSRDLASANIGDPDTLIPMLRRLLWRESWEFRSIVTGKSVWWLKFNNWLLYKSSGWKTV